jgi:nucleotide-binding universal stress UspA family protein
MRKAMKILLAVDGSEASLAAVEEAARTPWPEVSVVRIVSATEIPFPTQQWAAPIPSGSYEEWERIFEERSIENTAQAMGRFGEIAGAQTEAPAKTLKSDPKIAILDEAEHWGADLIVVGTHGYNALERLWLGSVSRAVASHAKCSVEVARRRKAQGAGGQAMKILLAVDGSEFSDAAVEEIATRPWPKGERNSRHFRNSFALHAERRDAVVAGKLLLQSGKRGARAGGIGDQPRHRPVARKRRGA